MMPFAFGHCMTVSIYVGHDIVAHQPLPLLCHLVVDILSVSL